MIKEEPENAEEDEEDKKKAEDEKDDEVDAELDLLRERDEGKNREAKLE